MPEEVQGMKTEGCEADVETEKKEEKNIVTRWKAKTKDFKERKAEARKLKINAIREYVNTMTLKFTLPHGNV